MSLLTIAFLIYLIYVSYCKIVWLCFRGKQCNRFFAFVMSTLAPVVGSMPAVIIATKYEKQVGGVAPKMNDNVLRYLIMAFQMISVFMLFLPFFSSNGVRVDGINMILGLSVNGDIIFAKATFLAYLIVLPFVSAIITAVCVKTNVRNVISYNFSIISALTVFAIAVFADSDGELAVTAFLWLYCMVQVTIMLLSIFSIVKVRNAFLAKLEEEEFDEEIKEQKSKAHKFEEVAPADNMYRCAKCGTMVPKGEICACRKEAPSTLNKLMLEQNKKETSDFCVYCRRSLAPGEVCNCAGEGFGITVKPEQFEGRKCSYCGKLLVGDSTCVCEKIMTRSAPASEKAGTAEPRSYFEQTIDSTHVSDELAELQKKIESRFSEVKDSILNDKNNK